MRHSAEGPNGSEAGTADSFGDVIANRRQLLGFVEKRVRNRDAAEEILQEAFTRGLQRAGQLRSEELIRAWFYRLLRNAIVDYWRARRVEQHAVEQMAFDGTSVVPAPEVEAELCRCFGSQIRELRPDYAEILEKVDLGGIRPVDFANDHGLTPDNAMVRLHRARRALRERLLKLCGTCAEHGCLDCGCHHDDSCKGESVPPSACVKGKGTNGSEASITGHKRRKGTES